MRASSCIGRVGGLAVALGVGAAVVAGSTGVASADTSPGDSTSGNSSANDTSVRAPRESARTRAGAPRKSAASTVRPGNNGQAPAATATADSVTPSVKNAVPPETSVPSPAVDLPDLVRSAAARPTAAVALPAAATAERSQTPAALRAAAPSVAPAATVGTVTSVPSPFSASGNGSPAESTVVWAVFAAVRRFGRPETAPAPAATLFSGQIFTPKAARTSRFRNAAPTLAPRQTAESPTGVVTGTLGAYDANGDPLAFSVVSTPLHGVVQIDARGGFTYTPDKTSAHNGVTDQFTVTTSDAGSRRLLTARAKASHTATATVTVVVSPVNEAPTGTASVSSPNGVTGAVNGQINGSDSDGDPLTYSGSGTTSKGSVVVASDGTFTYTPTYAARHAAANLTATGADKVDNLTLTVSDDRGASTQVPVQVSISPANRAPTGTASSTVNSTAGVVTGSVAGSDADGDVLTYAGSTTTAKGSAVVAADGGFTYTPTDAARQNAGKPNATAADKSDSFTVTVTDGYGGSAAVQVNVVVAPPNTAPVASASVGSPNGGNGVVSGSVTATDADNDPLSYSVSKAAGKGTASVAANGAFTYTPTAVARHAAAKLTASAGDKADSFTITVSDGRGGTAAVPISVTVSGANSAPTGRTSVGVPDATTGVLAGAVIGADLDSDALTYTGPSSTSKGTISLSPNGSFTYTPTAVARHAAGFGGATTDGFTVTITDGYGGSVNVPVTVAVSPAAVNFAFGYTGSGWTDESKAAMRTAAARLSYHLVVNAPVTITYSALADNDPNSGLLATNYTQFASSSPGFYGTVVQTKILTGSDPNGANADSQISWNFGYPWAFGDSVSNSQYDFQSVAMHEMVHSLGMLTGVNPTNLGNTNWTTYDSWLSTSDGTKIIGPNYVFNTNYTANLTNGNGGLYFGGPNAVAVYGGPVPLYDPGSFSNGSSVSHLDPNYAPAGVNYLMDPTVGNGPNTRSLSAVEIGILKDLGYTVYQSGSYVFVFGFGLLRRRRPGRKR